MAAIGNWMSLSTPDPEWDQMVQNSMGGKQPDLATFPDIASLRKFLTDSKKAASASGVQIKGVVENDHQVPMRDGSSIACRVYSPEHPPSSGSPIAVIYHGGGWCLGGLENEEPLCRLISSRLGVTAVNVDYRLGPEHKFPTAVYDCHDATIWAAENATSLGADAKKGLIIGGTSAGGNLAAVVAHLWRDENRIPSITGCLLVIPAYCYWKYVPEKYKADYKSWDQNEFAPVLSRKALEMMVDNYIPDEEDRKNPLFSPLLWETGHSNLPPSHFQISGQDILRDEALIFERIMREQEGIATKVKVYPGQPHGFHSIAPSMKASATFVEDSVNGVKWLLEQGAQSNGHKM